MCIDYEKSIYSVFTTVYMELFKGIKFYGTYTSVLQPGHKH